MVSRCVCWVVINPAGDLVGCPKAVSYSGPTFVAIYEAQSNRQLLPLHTSLLGEIGEFTQIMWTNDSSAKSIKSITCD